MKILAAAGHGAAAPGARYFGYVEAKLMAELRNYVASRLRDRGHDVRSDGEGDENLPLTEAVKMVAGIDVAIELHTNASVDPRATGVEVVSLIAQQARAQRIAKAIAATLGIRVRGLGGWKPPEETPHRTLAFCSAGGLIVETFFLSRRPELDLYLERKHDVAEVTAAAVAS